MKSFNAYFHTFLRLNFLASLTQLTLLYFNLYLQQLLTQKILSETFNRGSCCALKFPYYVRPLTFIFNMTSTKVYFLMYYFLGKSYKARTFQSYLYLLTQKLLSKIFKRGSCCVLKFSNNVRHLTFIFNMTSTNAYFHTFLRIIFLAIIDAKNTF